MASKSLRFCNYPGCNELSRGTYCEKHQAVMDEKRADDKARPSAAKQGYDRAWQRCRDAHLAKNPLCVDCLKDGRVTPATLVHHATRLVEGGRRLDPDNLVSLCATCHAERHKDDRWKKV